MPANRNALRRVLGKTPRAANKLPAGPLLGVNLGNIAAASDVTDYETWLGKSVDSVNLHTGRNGWTDYVDSIGYVGGLYTGVDRPRHWSIPLFEANAGTLALAASGAYDSYWIAAAKAVLANAYPTTGPIIVRTGWEMNLAGQPWYCFGQEANYVTAFRRFVDCFRSISSRFAFVWCPNFETYDGGTLVDVELVYPGKNYVDIISMDFYVYFGGGGFTGDPAGAISYYFGGSASTNRRLNWLVSFAARMGKPVAIDEWGISSDGFETFIDYAADFFTTNGFYYSKWWEEVSAYDSFLSDGSYATTGTAYIDNFGVPSAVPWDFDATLENSCTLARWWSVYSASDYTTATGGVSQLNDKSSYTAHLTQGTSGNRPPVGLTSRNSLPALEYDGVTDILTSSTVTGIPVGQEAITVILAVYGESDLATFRYFFAINGSAGFQIGSGGSQNPRYQSSASNMTVTGSLVSNDRIITFRCPAGSSVSAKMSVDGGAETTATLSRSTSTVTDLSLGGGTAHVRIKEAVIIAGEASTDDIDRSVGRLYHKWGGAIASGHPYEFSPPTV